MKFGRMVEILKILEKYAGPEEDCIHPEHDQLWIGSEDWPISDEDRKELEALKVCFSDEGIFVWT